MTETAYLLVASDKKLQELVDNIRLEHPLTRFFEFSPPGLILKNLPGNAKLTAKELAEKLGIGDAAVSSLTSMTRVVPEVATYNLRFDFGHPQDGYLYVQHPCFSDYFLLPATINERMAQQKMGAFVKIAGNLGAKKIELLSGQLQAKSFVGNGNLDSAATQAGINASIEKNGSIARQVYAEYGRPTSPPFLSDEHTRWLAMDPMLDSMVSGRLGSDLLTMKVSLKFSDVFQFSGRVTGKFQAMGVDVGGAFKSLNASSWDFLVEFWPLSEIQPKGSNQDP